MMNCSNFWETLTFIIMLSEILLLYLDIKQNMHKIKNYNMMYNIGGENDHAFEAPFKL